MSIEDAIKEMKNLSPSETAINKVLEELNAKESDLYAANQIISEEISVVEEQKQIIEMIADYIVKHNYFDLEEFNIVIPTKDYVIEHFAKKVSGM